MSGFDISTFSLHYSSAKFMFKDSEFRSYVEFSHKDRNFIRGRSLNHRQFRQLLKDLVKELTNVFHSIQMSAGYHVTKVLKRFYLLRQEIITILEMKGRSTDELKDESWLQDLAFAVDITAHLNDLILKLQSKN